jgi:hypothetical protein
LILTVNNNSYAAQKFCSLPAAVVRGLPLLRKENSPERTIFCCRRGTAINAAERGRRGVAAVMPTAGFSSRRTLQRLTILLCSGFNCTADLRIDANSTMDY